METIKTKQSIQELCQKIDGLIKNKMEDEALQHINDFLKLYPNSAEALTFRGKILLIKNQDDDAICDLNQAIQLNQYMEESFYLRSTWFMKNKMWKEAQKDCEYALQLNQNYALAYVGLGKLMEEQEKNYDGLIFLKQAVELDDQCCSAFFNLGFIYCKIRDFKLALKNFNQAIEIDKNFTQAYEWRGMVFWIMDQKDQAMKDYYQVIQLDPKSYKAYTDRTFLNEISGKDINSMFDFTKVIELQPNLKFAYFLRGFLQMKILKIDEQEIRQILKNEVADQNSVFYKKFKLKQIIKGELQCIEKAIEDFNKVFELDPKFNQAYFYRNTLQGMIEGNENAFKDFINSSILKPSFANKQNLNESEIDQAFQYFQILQRFGIFETKLKETQKQMNLDYQSLLEQFFNTFLTGKKTKEELQIRELSKKIEQDPNSSIFYLNLGILQRKLGLDKMALENFNKAIQLDPKNILAYLKRARLFTKQKLYYQSLEEYQEILKVLELDQENYQNQNQQDSQQKIELLKSIQRGLTTIKLEVRKPENFNQSQTQSSSNLLQFLGQQIKKQMNEQSKCNNNQDYQQHIKSQQQQINIQVNRDNARIIDANIQEMNNQSLQLEIQEETLTIDYQDQLKQQRNLNQNNIISVDRTIFYILKHYPDLFVVNVQEFNLDNVEIDIKKQLVLENGLLLGQGSSGQVYYIINPRTNKPAALKVQQKCTFDDIIHQTNEFKLQFAITIKYPESIIGVQGKIIIKQYSIDNYKMYAYLDLGLGSLRYFRNQIVKFTDDQIDNIFDCILDSIIKIHSLNIAHGDIKLENIINTSDKGWVLADFGSAIAYMTPYGDYTIVGTMGYLPKYIRKAKNNNHIHYKMNLFKKDIYAFQLVMLQLIYYDENFYKLQQILDEQQEIHPKINQLYNKDLITVKTEFMKRKFIRKQLITELTPIYDYIIENFTLYDQYQIELNQYLYIRQFTQHNKFNNYLNILLRIQNIENLENRLNQIKIAKKFYQKYSPLISAQEIFDEVVYEYLTKLEYDLYFDIFEVKGARMLQLMICQGYQSALKTENYSLKLQEAEILYIMGNWNDARILINAIENVFELENDEQILKFCFLKARLNNLWVQANEELIHYIRNYKEPLQMIIEWKLIIMESFWIDKSQLKPNQIFSKFNFLRDEKFQKNLHPRNYIPEFFSDTQNFQPSFQALMEQMLLQNYDNYTIFYHFLIYCELGDIDDQYYNGLIRLFIQFIENNLQGYYFSWIAYDLFAQYLTHIKNYKSARYYFDRVLKLIQNDCPLNQFYVQYHFWRLELKEKQLCNWQIFNTMFNILANMKGSNQVINLQLLLVDEFNTQVDLRKFQLNTHTFSKNFFEQEDIKTNELLSEYLRRFYTIGNNFEKTSALVEDLLPQIYSRSGNNQNFDGKVLQAFSILAHFIIESEFSIRQFQYLERFLQIFIIFQSIEPTENPQEKFINEEAELRFHIYKSSIFLDYQKYQEAVNLYQSYWYNQKFY